jgi:hypothetical protein
MTRSGFVRDDVYEGNTILLGPTFRVNLIRSRIEMNCQSLESVKIIDLDVEIIIDENFLGHRW